jgi:hypothetical protein
MYFIFTVQYLDFFWYDILDLFHLFSLVFDLFFVWSIV